MTEGALFAIGSVVFILVSAAILWYGYARFNEVYERDQLAGDLPPEQQSPTAGSDRTGDRGR